MMPDVLIYLLKANAALLLLLGLYYALLRRLTFHQLNRAYLLGAGVFSLLYPLIDVSVLLVRPVQLGAVELPEWATLVGGTAGAAPTAAPALDYGLWLLGLYWSGIGFMLLRLLLQGASLAGVHRASRPAVAAGVPFRQVAAEVNPFSFWQTIYLNPEQHGATELPAILLHEQVHVRQWHTLDVLLAHLQRIMGWFSPGTWLLLRAVQENLEFITDEEVLRAGRLDARQYQYSLVRLSTLAPGPALVTPFSFITLKNRIRMMNSHASSRKQTVRYLLVLPLALGLLSFSAPEAASAMLTPKVTVAPAAGEDIEKATTISALPPAALAHIVKQYPGYRLIGVSELRAADGSNLRYKAEIAIGRRPKQVVFTEKGEPVAAVAAGEPLYYVDGKLTPKSEVDKLDPNSIESMNVLKGETARKTFGDKAANGVIVILTKANRNSAEVERFIKEHAITYTTAKPEDQKVINAIAAGQGVTTADLRGKLLIINDREATAEQATISKEKIDIILLMDAERATKKYGEKGRQGAIIIKTK